MSSLKIYTVRPVNLAKMKSVPTCPFCGVTIREGDEVVSKAAYKAMRRIYHKECAIQVGIIDYPEEPEWTQAWRDWQSSNETLPKQGNISNLSGEQEK